MSKFTSLNPFANPTKVWPYGLWNGGGPPEWVERGGGYPGSIISTPKALEAAAQICWKRTRSCLPELAVSFSGFEIQIYDDTGTTVSASKHSVSFSVSETAATEPFEDFTLDGRPGSHRMIGFLDAPLLGGQITSATVTTIDGAGEMYFEPFLRVDISVIGVPQTWNGLPLFMSTIYMELGANLVGSNPPNIWLVNGAEMAPGITAAKVNFLNWRNGWQREWLFDDNDEIYARTGYLFPGDVSPGQLRHQAAVRVQVVDANGDTLPSDGGLAANVVTTAGHPDSVYNEETCESCVISFRQIYEAPSEL